MSTEAVLERSSERLRQAERGRHLPLSGCTGRNSALMTCIVATPLQRDHIHFIDGAAGGYAMAAANMKAKAVA